MIDRKLILPDGAIAADASSLLYLLRLDVLSAYCRLKRLLISRTVFEELTVPGKCGSGVFVQLGQENLFVITEIKSNEPAGIVSKKLSPADRSIIQLFRSCKLQAVLTDDGALCRYCRTHRIPYINTPVSLFSLVYNKRIGRSLYYELLEKAYQEGRYAHFVKRYMNAINRQYMV